MKKIINKLFILISLIFILFISINNNTYAKFKVLDRIREYIVTVDPSFDDGSLNIKIDVKWEVLDDSYDGPLKDIKIGVANWHVDNIVALSSNIKNIKYISSDGSFIHFDLDRSYYKGEILDFSFKFNQSYMYHIDNNYIVYDYNPGYFNEIIVDKAILKWNSNNVDNIADNGFKIIDGYYTYESALDFGEYITINLRYDKNAFKYIDPVKTYTNESEKYPWLMPTIIFGSMALIIIIVYIINKITRDPYKSERGFYVINRPLYYWHRPYYRNYRNGGVTKEGKPINSPTSVSSGRHYGGGGCACACACACAGGGRAGCSMKDFYNTNLKSNNVINILREDLDVFQKEEENRNNK